MSNVINKERLSSNALGSNIDKIMIVATRKIIGFSISELATALGCYYFGIRVAVDIPDKHQRYMKTIVATRKESPVTYRDGTQRSGTLFQIISKSRFFYFIIVAHKSPTSSFP